MAMHRKNRSKPRGSVEAQPWFINNVRRQRRRNQIAKASRKRNRG